MSTQEEARKSMAKQRQHDEHLQASVLGRSTEEVGDPTVSELEETTRGHMAQQRHQHEHMDASMLGRSVEEVEKSDKYKTTNDPKDDPKDDQSRPAG